ncbi:unnamed protein product [Didymodactylos carnosus]|uniref:RRM domain-containing protein n=2 Tax=Didymodactylos carnosus TaxID=1234261 RepID=A0A814M256_9BILA|nr:unnamed protein product [Didymodactylos carnosus]CAF3838058.1 unnamed protein product [Didymodactylos carnosus]
MASNNRQNSKMTDDGANVTSTPSHDTRQASSSIHVNNLSYDATEEQLYSSFCVCGDIKSVRIITDRLTGNSRGFAFVEFKNTTAVSDAIKLDGMRINGRPVKITVAQPRNSINDNRVVQNREEYQRNTPSRTRVVHCKKSQYDVYIGRPEYWGNPFVIGKDGDRSDVIRKYRAWIMKKPEMLERAKTELRGKVLACWCKPEACHGDVLAEIADND